MPIGNDDCSESKKKSLMEQNLHQTCKNLIIVEKIAIVRQLQMQKIHSLKQSKFELQLSVDHANAARAKS